MTRVKKALFVTTFLSLPIVAFTLLAQLPSVPAEPTGPAAVRPPAVMSDGEKLAALGQIAVATDVAIEYDLSAWNGSLDLTISSLLPGDARTTADAICTAARTNFTWESHYTVRVFLPVGDRPAASCQI